MTGGGAACAAQNRGDFMAWSAPLLHHHPARAVLDRQSVLRAGGGGPGEPKQQRQRQQQRHKFRRVRERHGVCVCGNLAACPRWTKFPKFNLPSCRRRRYMRAWACTTATCRPSTCCAFGSGQ